MAQKGLRIRIEQCDLLTNEVLEDYLIDYIKTTFREYASRIYKKENTLPIRNSNVKLSLGMDVFDLIIKVSGQKNKRGQLRYVDFTIVEIP